MDNRSKGTIYEEKAFKYLEDKGLKLIEKNFRCKGGEIDGIFKDGNIIVFLEVKYRKNNSSGYALEAVTKYKMKQISKVALYYITLKKLDVEGGYRFDVIGIDNNEIRWIKDAFPYMYI